MIVVEDECEGSLQATVEFTEKVPNENRDPLAILGSEKRQRLAPPRRRQTKKIKESCNVGITIIYLIPEIEEFP